MASAWGASWGFSWGSSWGGLVTPGRSHSPQNLRAWLIDYYTAAFNKPKPATPAEPAPAPRPQTIRKAVEQAEQDIEDLIADLEESVAEHVVTQLQIAAVQATYIIYEFKKVPGRAGYSDEDLLLLFWAGVELTPPLGADQDLILLSHVI